MNDAAIDLDRLRAWIGRTESTTDRIDPGNAAALAATFDHDKAPATGDALPPLWHWAYFRPAARTSEIGHDGHPRLGGFMPPIPLPRRMWVGGRLTFHRSLHVGDEVARRTTITDLTAKSGRNGQLIFLTLRHEITTPQGLAVTEEQDLVYRAAAAPSPPAAAPDWAEESGPLPDADWRDRLIPDPVLLFRYSALTFNAHRIHYDLPYARQEEGYRGLVVHGPLTATLLARHFSAHRPGRLAAFSFRGLQPLFCGEELALCGKARAEVGFDLWAEMPTGAAAMTATATLADA